MKQNKIEVEVCTEEMVLNFIKWLRNEPIANRLFNYKQLKQNLEVASERDLLDLFINNNHITSKAFPIGYSILEQTEN